MRTRYEKRIYHGSYVEVVRENGSFLIDLKDEHFLESHSFQIKHWKNHKGGPYVYEVYQGKGHYQNMLHRLIMDAKKHDIIDHINRNTLDNRRENLRLASVSLNRMNSLFSKSNYIYHLKIKRKTKGKLYEFMTWRFHMVHNGVVFAKDSQDKSKVIEYRNKMLQELKPDAYEYIKKLEGF